MERKLKVKAQLRYFFSFFKQQTLSYVWYASKLHWWVQTLLSKARHCVGTRCSQSLTPWSVSTSRWRTVVAALSTTIHLPAPPENLGISLRISNTKHKAKLKDFSGSERKKSHTFSASCQVTPVSHSKKERCKWRTSPISSHSWISEFRTPHCTAETASILGRHFRTGFDHVAG